MKETKITMPKLALIAGTRGALGVGIGFLLADKISREQRRAAGLALVLVGVLTTIPLLLDVLDQSE